MEKKDREKMLREINGALLDILSLQERVEARQIKTSAEADKIFRLCGNLQRRVDLIERKILNDLEIRLGG